MTKKRTMRRMRWRMTKMRGRRKTKGKEICWGERDLYVPSGTDVHIYKSQIQNSDGNSLSYVHVERNSDSAKSQ
jgi:hypothetical protein